MFSAKREHACIEDPRTTYLVEEFAVRILSKQCLPHSGGGGVLKKFQSSLKSVVNIDLSIATYNNHAAGPNFLCQYQFVPNSRRKGSGARTYRPSARGCDSSIVALISLPTSFL